MAPSRHLPRYVTQSEEARLHYANPRVGYLFFDTPNSRTPPLLLASIDFTRTHQELRVVSVRNAGPRGRTVITWQTFLPAPLPCAWLPCRNGWPPAPYHFHPPLTHLQNLSRHFFGHADVKPLALQAMQEWPMSSAKRLLTSPSS